LVPNLYLKPFSRYLHLNTECAQTDGQTEGRKEKSITIYFAVHSVQLADITRPRTDTMACCATVPSLLLAVDANNCRW